MLDVSKIIITPEILLMISEIDEFKGSWQFLSRMKSNRLKTLKTIALSEILARFMNEEDTELPNVNKTCDNLTSTYTKLYENYQTAELTENTVTQIHQNLSNGDIIVDQKSVVPVLTSDLDKSGDHWKDLNITFYQTTLFEVVTPVKLFDLVEWTQTHLEQKTYHPLLLSSVFMAYFLISKPFQNHNVHLSRVLTTLILLKTGYHYVPYSSFERIIEINHEYYSLALKRTQESVLSDEPDFETWITFFLKIMITQKRNLEKKLDIEKKANRHVSALDSQIINIISEFEKISIGGIQKKTGANRNTLKKHLARLTEENYIVRFGKARASWYSLSI